ncbi:MAG: 6-carboxytetrahydropterin synthase [Bacteroidales bacterium]|nr:6-carboxytetrahydropterin synthase [Bacteroidales bacterium]
MAVTRVSKIFEFEMAHALWNYQGQCHNIHGHSYKLIVTVIGIPINKTLDPQDGILIDFNDLDKIVNRKIIHIFDHTLALSSETTENLVSALKSSFDKVLLLPFQPTCENLVGYFAEKLQNDFNYNVKLHSLKLYETTTSYCEWFAEDNL